MKLLRTFVPERLPPGLCGQVRQARFSSIASIRTSIRRDRGDEKCGAFVDDRPFRKRKLIRSRAARSPRRDESASAVILCEFSPYYLGKASAGACESHAGGIHMHVYPRLAGGVKGDAEIHARASDRRRSPHDLDQFLYRIHETSRGIRLDPRVSRACPL